MDARTDADPTHAHQHGAHAHGGARPSFERRVDVAVVGGSAAGLGAALQLGRQRRSVIVVDAGDPRNAPAEHMHSYLGHEGLAPGALTAIGREEVRSYGGEVLAGRVATVTRADDGRFRVHLASGQVIVARRVVAATGLVDELPAIEGLAEHWGRDVIHCPFCHGFEVRGQRVVQIVTSEAGLHPAVLLRQLTDRFTVVLHEGVGADDAQAEALRAAGVQVVAGPVRRVVAHDGRVAAVELVDGTRIDADAVAVGPRFRVRVEPFEALGLDPVAHPSGLGDVVEVDAQGETAVPGLYAAGNVVDPSLQVLQAAAAGTRVGAMVSFSLAHEDVELARRPAPGEDEWDHRYGGEPVWSGNPNGSLVHEVGSLGRDREAGGRRALDVGAGEGGDAIWLAEQGWRVTASDISPRGLAHVAAAAERRGVAVDLLHADANALDPFEPGAYDLVSAQYASIPRSPDHRAARNLAAAVAPGGTLLVVGHDLGAMRAVGEDGSEPGHQMAFDPDAYVRIDDIAAVLADDPAWTIEVHETRPRPAGAASNHVDDVVLRARRSA